MTFSHDIIKKRLLIVGATGMLGQRVINRFIEDEGVELLACSVEDKYFDDSVNYVQADITKREDVKRVVYDFYPDYIINTAAFTNVDRCESERELAWKINVKGVEYLSETARVLDSYIIHISTDYVFDGLYGPYDERAVPNPLGYYARTKLASENALRISGASYTVLRTNVLFGPAKYGRPDFVKWVVNSLKEGKQIKIVTDQIGNPTYLDDLVQGISKVIKYRKPGIYNIGGRDILSRYDFTMRIAEHFGLDKSLVSKILTCDLNQPAKRPLKSGLITLKAETELDYKPHTIYQALCLMKQELGL
jgi:dTDP-4-dehydrorhamnose reductase